MLTRGEDYAFQSPSLVRKKLRNAELKTGAPRLSTRHTGTRQRVTPDERDRDRRAADPGRERLPPDQRRVRARHRGAHLQGRLRGKQRGRPQSPRNLPFSSSVTRTHAELSHRKAPTSRPLDFLSAVRRMGQGVPPDPRLAKAVVDRLTHRAHIIDTGTESWRFRHGLKRKVGTPAQ